MTSLKGKIAIVTGANTGLGFETALSLYHMGARVIVASRDKVKAENAVDNIRSSGAGGTVDFGLLNLSSLTAVEKFAVQIKDSLGQLDLLINNAGVMVPPASTTEDGYEMQFGVNFLAHFVLTGHLFGLLEATPGARVVTLSSIGHRGAQIDFDNLALQKPYDKWREYGQSKLADLIFALEFDRLLRLKNCQLSSIAAHPGISQTELTRSINEAELPAGLRFMSAADGAAPTLVAATSPAAQGGQYWGPDGPDETSGAPALAKVDVAARNPEVNKRLWQWAQQATGVIYP